MANVMGLLLLVFGAGSVAQTGASEPRWETFVEQPVWLGEPPSVALTAELADSASVELAPVPGAASTGLSIDTSNREAVREFYNNLYGLSDIVAMSWTGNRDTCTAGGTSARFKEAVLLRINWLRALAGVPADVSFDNTYNLQNQQAALVMSSNNQLSHTPPSNWHCWTQTAYDAAGKSNIALGLSGPNAINAYIRDNGSNNAAVGHRRWIFYPQTRFMGTGDLPTGTYLGGTAYAANALRTIDMSSISNPRPAVRDDFVAWPPKGFVPYPLVFGRWSFSYPGANFSQASVTVSQSGVNIPASVVPPQNGYGENTLVWLLQGTTEATLWQRPTSDLTYNVTVGNVLVNAVARNFSYAVTVFDPATPTASAPICTLSAAPTTIRKGTSATLTAICTPTATSYVWQDSACADLVTATCTVHPAVTTRYSVIGSNNNVPGPAATATVTVKPVGLIPILMLLLD